MSISQGFPRIQVFGTCCRTGGVSSAESARFELARSLPQPPFRDGALSQTRRTLQTFQSFRGPSIPSACSALLVSLRHFPPGSPQRGWEHIRTGEVPFVRILAFRYLFGGRRIRMTMAMPTMMTPATQITCAS